MPDSYFSFYYYIGAYSENDKAISKYLDSSRIIAGAVKANALSLRLHRHQTEKCIIIFDSIGLFTQNKVAIKQTFPEAKFGFAYDSATDILFPFQFDSDNLRQYYELGINNKEDIKKLILKLNKLRRISDYLPLVCIGKLMLKSIPHFVFATILLAIFDGIIRYIVCSFLHISGSNFLWMSLAVILIWFVIEYAVTFKCEKSIDKSINAYHKNLNTTKYFKDNLKKILKADDIFNIYPMEQLARYKLKKLEQYVIMEKIAHQKKSNVNCDSIKTVFLHYMENMLHNSLIKSLSLNQINKCFAENSILKTLSKLFECPITFGLPIQLVYDTISHDGYGVFDYKSISTELNTRKKHPMTKQPMDLDDLTGIITDYNFILAEFRNFEHGKTAIKININTCVNEIVKFATDSIVVQASKSQSNIDSLYAFKQRMHFKLIHQNILAMVNNNEIIAKSILKLSLEYEMQAKVSSQEEFSEGLDKINLEKSKLLLQHHLKVPILNFDISLIKKCAQDVSSQDKDFLLSLRDDILNVKSRLEAYANKDNQLMMAKYNEFNEIFADAIKDNQIDDDLLDIDLDHYNVNILMADLLNTKASLVLDWLLNLENPDTFGTILGKIFAMENSDDTVFSKLEFIALAIVPNPNKNANQTIKNNGKKILLDIINQGPNIDPNFVRSFLTEIIIKYSEFDGKFPNLNNYIDESNAVDTLYALLDPNYFIRQNYDYTKTEPIGNFVNKGAISDMSLFAWSKIPDAMKEKLHPNAQQWFEIIPQQQQNNKDESDNEASMIIQRQIEPNYKQTQIITKRTMSNSENEQKQISFNKKYSM